MRVLAATLAALLLTGCGTVSSLLGRGGSDERIEPPAELTPFEPLASVRELWERDVGKGSEEYFLKLNVAVDGEQVFAATREGEVKAYDAASGEPRWRADTDVALASGPAAGAGLVLVGGSDGQVVALAPASGDILWRQQLSSEVLAAPQASGEVVVARTVDGRLYGLDARTGSRLWVYDRSVPVLTLRGTSTPVLTSDLALSGFDSGGLVALTLAGGQPVWDARITLPSGRSELSQMVDIDGEPVVAGDTVYVAAFQGRTAAVDLRSGTVLWRQDLSSHAGLAVDERAVYVTDEESHLWALDRASGTPLWRQEALARRALTAPVVFGDYLVVGDGEGYLHWLRRRDGELGARVRLDKEGIVTPPAVAGDRLYAYSRDGVLAAFALE